jgi:inner membrane protein
VKRSTHLAVGLAVVTPLAMAQDLPLAAACAWFGLAGATMPDWLDFRSDLRQPLRLRHRGISHSLAALATCSAVAWLVLTVVTQNPLTVGEITLAVDANVPAVLTMAFALGFGSHLVADACTPVGIEPWLPLSRRKFWLLPKRLRGRTGGRLDALTRWAAWSVVAFALVIIARGWLALPG